MQFSQFELAAIAIAIDDEELINIILIKILYLFSKYLGWLMS